MARQEGESFDLAKKARADKEGNHRCGFGLSQEKAIRNVAKVIPAAQAINPYRNSRCRGISSCPKSRSQLSAGSKLRRPRAGDTRSRAESQR